MVCFFYISVARCGFSIVCSLLFGCLTGYAVCVDVLCDDYFVCVVALWLIVLVLCILVAVYEVVIGGLYVVCYTLAVGCLFNCLFWCVIAAVCVVIS